MQVLLRVSLESRDPPYKKPCNDVVIPGTLNEFVKDSYAAKDSHDPSGLVFVVCYDRVG